MSIDADTDTKDKWLKQYETYYYQSKINETDKTMLLALVTACLDTKLTEACLAQARSPPSQSRARGTPISK